MKKTVFTVIALMVSVFMLNGNALAGCFSTYQYGVKIRYCSSYVYTPNGTRVTTVHKAQSDFSWIKKISIVRDTLETYPRATVKKYPTPKYNCHSYAWHSQSTSNNKWIDSPGDDKYWQDGSYKKTTDELKYQKISYAYGDHSGIVKPRMCGVAISKWGAGPLMEHSFWDSPYRDSKLNFYKRNN